VQEIQQCLTYLPKVHGFPIVDKDNKLIGLVTRESLMVLLAKECWLERDINSQICMAELHSGQDLANYKKSMASIIGDEPVEEEEAQENARFSLNNEDLSASKVLLAKSKQLSSERKEEQKIHSIEENLIAHN
jgi:hypothetical protein